MVQVGDTVKVEARWSQELSYVKLSHKVLRQRSVLEGGLCCSADDGGQGWELFDECASYLAKRATRRLLTFSAPQFAQLLEDGRFSQEALHSAAPRGLETCMDRVDGAQSQRFSVGGVLIALEGDPMAVSGRLEDDAITCLANDRTRSALLRLLR